ncbi:MAG: hypothetical protein ABS46_10540 [Cytophagaceae bacterium SCN 52-12]|nr:MAG: hypothetical protein ABS46_10540 [Cytophagaceae bacterium SCN 52-12]
MFQMIEVKNYIAAVLLASLLLGCDEEPSPCTRLVNGVYKYPELPNNHNFSHEQIHDYWDLPKDIWNCISTDGLIESCLTYPEINVIYAGSTPQKGYNLVFSQFSGLGELERRADASDHLLVKYKSIDPLEVSSFKEELEQGQFVINLCNIEIILSQYIYLNKLTNKQKKALTTRARSVYLLKREAGSYHGVFGLAFTAAILGRLMKLDNYSPFMEVYNPKQQNWSVVEQYWGTTFETTETIYAISEDYLNSLN